MWVWLDWFGRILVDASLATTILLCLVILLMLLCQQPARRIVLVQTAIVLALFTFPLIAASLLTRTHAAAWFPGLDTGVSRGRSAPSQVVALPEQSPTDPVTQGRIPVESTEESTWRKERLPLRAITFAYLAGLSVAVFWTLLGFWGIHRLVGVSVQPSPATLLIYEELCMQMGERLPFPGLRVSGRISRPVLVGAFRSFILIPTACDERGFDEESLKIILLHELAHTVQRDTYFNAMASLAQSLWFFLPFLWWMRTQLRIDQEFVADQRVVVLTKSPAGYATRLVALATPQKGPISGLRDRAVFRFTIHSTGRWELS